MSDYTSLLEALKKVISSSQETENKSLYYITNIIYSLENDISLYTFAKILSEDQLLYLMQLKGGETVKIPKKSEYDEKKRLAIVYYLKHIKEMEWKEIYKFFEDHGSPLEENAIALAKRLVKVNQYIERLSKDLTN